MELQASLESVFVDYCLFQRFSSTELQGRSKGALPFHLTNDQSRRDEIFVAKNATPKPSSVGALPTYAVNALQKDV